MPAHRLLAAACSARAGCAGQASPLHSAGKPLLRRRHSKLRPQKRTSITRLVRCCSRKPDLTWLVPSRRAPRLHQSCCSDASSSPCLALRTLLCQLGDHRSAYATSIHVRMPCCWALPLEHVVAVCVARPERGWHGTFELLTSTCIHEHRCAHQRLTPQRGGRQWLACVAWFPARDRCRDRQLTLHSPAQTPRRLRSR